jgi:hypothetical protein
MWNYFIVETKSIGKITILMKLQRLLYFVDNVLLGKCHGRHDWKEKPEKEKKQILHNHLLHTPTPTTSAVISQIEFGDFPSLRCCQHFNLKLGIKFNQNLLPLEHVSASLSFSSLIYALQMKMGVHH